MPLRAPFSPRPGRIEEDDGLPRMSRQRCTQTRLPSGTVARYGLRWIKPMRLGNLILLKGEHGRPGDGFTVEHELNTARPIRVRRKMLNGQEPSDKHVQTHLFEDLSMPGSCRRFALLYQPAGQDQGWAVVCLHHQQPPTFIPDEHPCRQQV